MWPFEKKLSEQQPLPAEAREPLPPLKIRPCWCGSVRFASGERFLDLRWCMECGTMFKTDVRDPCGG